MATRVDLHQTFGSRLAGLESLIAARDSRFVDAERLRREADDVDGLAPFYDHTATGAAYGAFAELLRIAALLVQWRAAVLAGEADSDRFLRAAKERRRIWKEEAEPTEGAANVIAVADGLVVMSSFFGLSPIFPAPRQGTLHRDRTLL